MTALAGFIDWSGSPHAEQNCHEMLAAQQGLGGCGSRLWSGPGAAIGVDAHADWPGEGGLVTGGEGRFALAADLRLDNRDELAAALRLGPQPGDAALLLRALERWGEDAVRRLRGEFAFAWWDAQERRLVLARDFLGQRPLHLVAQAGFVAFASMPRGLHALAEVPRAPNLAAVADYLSYLPDAPDESFFAGIAKVPPGTLLTLARGGERGSGHWQPQRGLARTPSEAEAHEAVRVLMDRATAARLHGGEGRVASQLSGGLDSSTVTATAARLRPEGRVVAYTSVPAAGFPDEGGGRILNEAILARRVAALHPNIDLFEVPPGGRTAVDCLKRATALYERPAINGANEVWLQAINDDAAARGLKILLHGSMGNLGFSHTGMEVLARQFATLDWRRLAGNLAGLRGSGMSWPGLAFATLSPLLPAPAWRAVMRRRYGGAMGEGALLRSGQAASLRLEERARERGHDPNERPPLDAFDARVRALRRADIGNFTKALLGGWGLALRDPTADQELLDYLLALPPELYLRDGEPRALARRAFADRLPPELARERRKGLQSADWHLHYVAARERVAAEAERIAASPPARELIDTDRLLEAVRAIPAHGWDDQSARAFHGSHIMRALAAGHFLRRAGG